MWWRHGVGGDAADALPEIPYLAQSRKVRWSSPSLIIDIILTIFKLPCWQYGTDTVPQLVMWKTSTDGIFRVIIRVAHSMEYPFFQSFEERENGYKYARSSHLDLHHVIKWYARRAYRILIYAFVSYYVMQKAFSEKIN